MLKGFRKYIHKVFSLDLRSVALMRIFLAIVLIGDITVRLLDVKAFYSNQGVLPLGLMHEGHYFNPFSISLHMMNGAIWFQVVLLVVAYGCALGLLAGYRTRLFAILSFFLLLSIQTRNPLVLQGGDDFLRLSLFWAIFLPMGRVWSIDAVKQSKPISYQYFSWANVGYILLLFSVYFFTSLMKHSTEWYGEGSALYYAFSIDQMAYPLAKALYPYPKLLQVLTYCTIYLELLAPLLLLIPFKPRLFRSIFVVSITGLHIGIGLTLQVGYFFLIAIVAMIGLWPRRFLLPFEKLGLYVTKWRATNWVVERPKREHHTRISLPTFYKGIVLSAIVISLVWNLGNVAKIPSVVRTSILPLGKVTGLTQNWGMFAPTVFKGDGWFVYEGITVDGDTIDLFKPQEHMNYDKPKWPVDQYPNAKWRKLGENLVLSEDESFRTPFCRYQLRRHNSSWPDQEIWKLNVLYFREKTLPDYQVDEIQKGLICSCFLKSKQPEKTKTEQR